MEEIVFKSQRELYDRVKPALRSKRKMLSKAGFKGIKEEDIWDCMSKTVWANLHSLELCEIVDGILHMDNLKIVSFYHDKHFSDIDEVSLPKLK